MAQKQINVDGWLRRETEHVRKALENASRYFTRTDVLTVNTLEAISSDVADKGRKYVFDIIKNETEFFVKSSADRNVKNKRPGVRKGNCSKGHWITKDHHIFICE